jgi:hypothetical protein
MFRDLPSPSEKPWRTRSILPVCGVVLALGILLLGFQASLHEPEPIPPPHMEVPIPGPKPTSLDFSGYVGEQACARCHPGETAAHSGSGHHRTLWPAGEGALARWLDGKRILDPELAGVEWFYRLRGKELDVERRQQGKVERMSLEFGVGSGKHGVSYVTTIPGPDPSADRAAVEHRFSYFTASRQLQITLGQEREDASRLRIPHGLFGRPLAPDRALACLACHATLTSREKLDHLDPATLIPNVSCERCHGPGRDHIEAIAAGQTDDLKMPMTLLTEPRYQVEQCGECHRLPSAVASSSLRRDDPNIVRLQSVGLFQSACFQNGLGTLKCTSCHEPHARTSRDHQAYEAVCLECHQAGGPRRACPVSPGENCIRCHMPRRDVPGGFVFTDHWIAVNRP